MNQRVILMTTTVDAGLLTLLTLWVRSKAIKHVLTFVFYKND